MKNQKEMMKQLFTANPNEWIPLFDIMKFAAQYNARIKELRESGMFIKNKINIVDGIKHSWFMYSPEGQGMLV